MHLSRRFTRVALSLGLAAAGTVTTGVVAADATTYKNCLYFRSANGCATTDGAWAEDRTADGYSVVLHYRYTSSRPYLSTWDHNGAGNGRTWDRLKTPLSSIRQVQLCKGVYSTGRTFACSAWHTR